MNFREKLFFVVFAGIPISALCLFVVIFYHLFFLHDEQIITGTPTENVLFDTLPEEQIDIDTTENVLLVDLPGSYCPPQYEGYCINGGRCYVQEDANVPACICRGEYGGKRCEKFLWYH